MITLLLITALADPVRYKPGTGLILNAKDSPYRLTAEVFVQPAVQVDAELGEPAQGDFVLRRARLDLEARLSQHLRARLQLAGDDGDLHVRDATAEVYVGPVRLRGGLVRMPGGLDRELSGRRMSFLHRTPVAGLFPNRLLGFDARVRVGPFFAHAGVGKARASTQVDEVVHVDVTGRVGVEGDRYLASVRGLVRPRPGGAPGDKIDAAWGPDLVDPLTWTGTGWAAGGDVAGLIGPVRLAADGAVALEGRTDGTVSGHTLHAAVMGLVGVTPFAKDRADAGALWHATQGLEITARGVFARTQPAPGAGLGASYGEGGVSVGYAPWPSLHVYVEGVMGALLEDDQDPRLGGGARFWFTVGP